nr:MAG TPA: 10 kDa chaperonin [Bacteriophage sp.]
MEDKMIDQTQLAEDLSSKIKYEFRQMFLVKPLEPVKVKKKISEPVAKDTKPKKDKDGIEAVDYDEVKTEIKEVDSDFSRAVVLKLPYEYTHPYDDEKIQQMPIKVGDIVIYRPSRGAMYFDLLKDSQLVSLYDIVATETVEK